MGKLSDLQSVNPWDVISHKRRSLSQNGDRIFLLRTSRTSRRIELAPCATNSFAALSLYGCAAIFSIGSALRNGAAPCALTAENILMKKLKDRRFDRSSGA